MHSLSSKNIFTSLFSKNKKNSDQQNEQQQIVESDYVKTVRVKKEFIEELKNDFNFTKVFLVDEINLDEVVYVEIKNAIDAEKMFLKKFIEELSNAKMNLNIYSVQISVRNSGGNLHFEFLFDLKNNGIQWAIFFKKYLLNLFEKTSEERILIISDLIGTGTRDRDKFLLIYKNENHSHELPAQEEISLKEHSVLM